MSESVSAEPVRGKVSGRRMAAGAAAALPGGGNRIGAE